MNVQEIKAWLDTLKENDMVGIDEGGLILQSVSEPDAYLEVGGLPEEE